MILSDKSVCTVLTLRDVDQQNEQLHPLQRLNIRLEEKHMNETSPVLQLRNDDERTHFYTGLPSYAVQFLVAISLTGAIVYISKCYGEHSSDKHLTRNCGFLKHIQHDDLVLADKGFDIRDDLASNRCITCSSTVHKRQITVVAKGG